MRKSLLVVLGGGVLGILAATACGEEETTAMSRPPLPDFTGDGGPDAIATTDGGTDAEAGAVEDGGPRCNPSAAFGPARRIDELSIDGPNEWVARISPDELFAVLTRQDNEGQKILTTVRPTRNAMWSAPVVVAGPWGTARVADPNVAELNGTPTLFFTEEVGGAGFDVRYVTWDPVAKAVVGSATTIFAAAETEAAPTFVAATSELWFLRGAMSVARLYQGTVTGTTFGLPVQAPVLARAEYKQNGSIAFSQDGLTAWFGAWPVADGGPETDVDIYRATRPSKDMPFTNVTAVSALNTKYFEQPLSVTPDGCRIYFSSNRNASGGANTSIDLYVSERGF